MNLFGAMRVNQRNTTNQRGPSNTSFSGLVLFQQFFAMIGIWPAGRSSGGRLTRPRGTLTLTVSGGEATKNRLLQTLAGLQEAA